MKPKTGASNDFSYFFQLKLEPKMSDSPKLSHVIPRGGNVYKLNSRPQPNQEHYLKPAFAYVGKVLPRRYSQRKLVMGM